MKAPELGRCGECRWWECFAGHDDGMCHHESMSRHESKATTVDEYWCSAWEPPEGRVCGNCDLWFEQQSSCTLTTNKTRIIWSCDHWRWTGPSPT